MPKKIDKISLRKLRETWDDVNVAALTEEEVLKFRKQKEAVDLYIDDVRMDVIVSRTGLQKSRVHQLVSRCVTPVETGEIPGYNALIPRKILRPQKSKIELLFNRYPKIGEKIRGIYFGDRAFTSEHRISVRSLHKIFLRECREAAIECNEFPFNLKDYGYEALRVYINKVANSELTKAIKREGKNQRQQFMSTGYGEAITLNPLSPFDLVQVDGHVLDLVYTVETTDTNGIEIRDIATRMWLIAVIDVATRCIIGYSLSPHENYNRFDVLKAIRNAIIPHEHKEFALKSLHYPENGGFPSETIPETRWALFNTIMLDNAKSHLATDVVDKLTNELLCVVNFGAVSTPESRGIVERLFGTLEQAIHRLPMTTGSNANDPKRRNPEKYAKETSLSYDDICEIVESLIAQYNNSAHSSLQGLSPLEMMEKKIREAFMPFYIVPEEKRIKVHKLTNYTIERVLRGDYKKGKQLRINYMSATYVACDLMIPQSMANESVLIEVDPSDMRTVKMYLKDGSFFCTMRALGEYGRIRHGLKTREMANKARNKRANPNTIFSPDITLLTEELNERGKENRRSRTKSEIIKREFSDDKTARREQENANELMPFKPLRSIFAGESSHGRELTSDEIQEIYKRYPGDDFSAIREINRIKKG